MRGAAGLLHPHDLVVDLRVAAGEERAPVDHHVDLVGAGRDDLLDLAQLHVERALAGRERGRDGGDVHAAAASALDGDRNQVRVDADRGAGGHARIGGIGVDRLRRERRDLAGRVGALERGQVDAADGELERLELRLLLDRALRERGGALLERDRIHGADPREPRLERKLEPARKSRSLGHASQCSPVRFRAVKRLLLRAGSRLGLLRPAYRVYERLLERRTAGPETVVDGLPVPPGPLMVRVAASADPALVRRERPARGGVDPRGRAGRRREGAARLRLRLRPRRAALERGRRGGARLRPRRRGDRLVPCEPRVRRFDVTGPRAAAPLSDASRSTSSTGSRSSRTSPRMRRRAGWPSSPAS